MLHVKLSYSYVTFLYSLKTLEKFANLLIFSGDLKCNIRKNLYMYGFNLKLNSQTFV